MKEIKKAISLALVLAVILSFFCGISTASAMNIVVIPEGDYIISPSAYNDYALDAAGGYSDAGTRIWLYQKNGTEAQVFSVVHVGEGWIKIVLKKNPQMCLKQVGASKNGARIWLWPDDGADSCYYRAIDCGDGTYKLQSKREPYRIVDLSNNQAYNGANVQFWDLHDTPAGKWRFTPVNSAASVTFPNISSSQYISTYALASSGRIYAYTSASLSVTTGGWVDAATDLCQIIQISGSAVQVSYPVSYGRRTAWFPLNQFLTSGTPSSCKTSQGQFTVYRRASGYSTIGSVYQNDTVYVLGNNNGRTQLIYPVSGGLWKMGFANSSDVQKFLGDGSAPQPDSNSGSWQYPVSSAYVCGNDWSQYYAPRASVGRPDHCGIDIASSNGNTAIYAAANGTVAKAGWNSSNGYYVVIQHNLSGKTVYSFYAHLSSISCYSGAVEKGTQIGVIGNTGERSGGIHLHFAVVDTLWAGSYYGYVPSFSGDKVTYSGVTYYNPHYIVSNGALPG